MSLIKSPDTPLLNSHGVPIRSNREWREIAQAAEERAVVAEGDTMTLRLLVTRLTEQLENTRRTHD